MINELVGFEHTHQHGGFSLLDGIAKPSESAIRLKQIGQKYMVLTDHGEMSGIPSQIRQCDEHGLNPIFGCEIYYNPDQPEIKKPETMKDYLKDKTEDEKAKQRKSFHFTLLAYNSEGYKNLVRLSSKAWQTGFYYKPRVNWSNLSTHTEGLICLSGCANSIIAQTLFKEGEARAFEEIEKYHNLFGDNFYLEIMLLDFDKQKPYNEFLIRAHKKYGIPLVLTNDCHYANKEDYMLQRICLLTGTKRTIYDLERDIAAGKDCFEDQDKNLWIKSEQEMNDKWEQDYQDVVPYELFLQAKLNTVKICEQAKGVQLDRTIKLPKFDNEFEELKKKVVIGAKNKNMPDTPEYWDRLKGELTLVKEKELSTYFLIKAMMCDAARKKSAELWGGSGRDASSPGRGSGPGFLVNYLLDITDVDPVKHGLLSSRFLSQARGGKQILFRFPESK